MRLTVLQDKNRNLMTARQAILNFFKEYFEELLNVEYENEGKGVNIKFQKSK